MELYTASVDSTVKTLGSNLKTGLNRSQYEQNANKYGLNSISKRKKRPFILKITDALSEPMLLILLFAFFVTFGINLGRLFKLGYADFNECYGILAAVVLSVVITLFMEGSSERAFFALDKMYDDAACKVLRDGEIKFVKKAEITVGDILVLESGDKVVADCRIAECSDLSADESALTGESKPVKKTAAVITAPVPLAERKNMLYSGTFIAAGYSKSIVVAIGDDTEIGRIAGELKQKKETISPLEQKLSSLGKTITLIGVFFAAFVFCFSLIRSVVSGTFSFDVAQNLFVSCIVLIVAAVPEGLPTIVAVSLALNMIKLAKENALIKKMVATETAGAVSVICSDKTGTLTTGKMEVEGVKNGERFFAADKISDLYILQNFALNTTAGIRGVGKDKKFFGSGTEIALVAAAERSLKIGVADYRKKFQVVARTPFSSKEKMMTTTIIDGGVRRTLLKGAPEKVLPLIDFTAAQTCKINAEISAAQRDAKRVLALAHDDGSGYVFDGFVVIKDQIQKAAFSAVKECKNAGIKVKMLTGDNRVTAFAVAKELGIAQTDSEVINADELEKMDGETLNRALKRITVVARSTPITKLKVVKALKSVGEVVAVTGDGINDAPAVKHADIGVAMGINGSEITKEAADVILLDDSFATIVKAVSFGRNVYKNLQRFILFQLSVNVSALAIITFCALIGVESPFNTLGLLWINVIMDGPPALTLGFESVGNRVMHEKPVKRDENIVGNKMLIRILLNALFIGGTVAAEISFDFLSVGQTEKRGAVFTLFVLFQLFNAFNCRKLGKESVFKGFSKNKIMIITFTSAFFLQVVITQAAYSVFGINPLSAFTWLKITATASLIVIVNETYKLLYRKNESKGLARRRNKKEINSFRNKKQIGA